MKRSVRPVPTALLALGFLALPPWGVAQDAGPAIGKPAPDFTLPDMYGKTFTLSDFRGSWVVLEWLNYGCPFVRKYYDAGAMQALQEKYGAMGVKWFSIVSSAPGKQGYYEPPEMIKVSQENGNKALATLLDPAGTVGRLYHAQTTPQMFLISPEGILLYNGAIDDKPTSNPADLEGAHNYLVAALEEAMAGKPVSVPLTKPYGCSVKY